jgi:hypothetical protein
MPYNNNNNNNNNNKPIKNIKRTPIINGQTLGIDTECCRWTE